MTHGTFCTVFDCMDGRCQEAVGAWCRHSLGAEYPDTITIAGCDGVLCQDEGERTRALTMARISADKHGSTQAVVVGHSGCAGFITTAEGHQEAVRGAVAKIAGAGVFDTVIGLYHDVDTDQLGEVCRAHGTKKKVSSSVIA